MKQQRPKAKPGDKRIGNNFWELRSKHGRDKLFASSDLLWEAACEYFQWCVDNPLLKDEGFAFQGIVTHDNFSLMRAFTIQGLTLYLDVNVQYFTDFENSLKEKNDQISKDFSLVVSRIRETIYNQKFSGAAAGLLNPNIIARDLGLVDKIDADVTNKGIIQFANVSKQFKDE
jgi:hypothetical protein